MRAERRKVNNPFNFRYYIYISFIFVSNPVTRKCNWPGCSFYVVNKRNQRMETCFFHSQRFGKDTAYFAHLRAQISICFFENIPCSTGSGKSSTKELDTEIYFKELRETESNFNTAC